MSKFYNLKAETPKGTYDFQDLKGKVVLIVNTANGCGFTPQFTGLQSLYQKNKEKGFEVIGFPSNNFWQEPGADGDIATTCQLNHGVEFPLMKKSDVNGPNTNEVFKYLKNEKSGILGLSRIKWNFEKFLVNREGQVVQRYASTTTPESIEKDIEKLL